MKSEENADGTRYSSREVISLIISLTTAIAVSYVYLVGMLTLTEPGPDTNNTFMAVIRGILGFFHIDFCLRMVRNFFQQTFPFFRNIGIIAAALSWAMGYLLLIIFYP